MCVGDSSGGAGGGSARGFMMLSAPGGLTARKSVEAQPSNFKAFAEHIKDSTQEEMAPVWGIPADTLRTVARSYARAKSAIIFWGMGVSQHVHGTDNARCLIALA